MIITEAYIIKRNGKHSQIQQVTLPQDYVEGFFGDLVIKLQAGQMVSSSIPRQTMPIKTITKDEWKRTFETIKDEYSE